MATWRITRPPGAWPHWRLVEDVEADYLVVENNGQQRLLLYQQQLVIGQPRDVVVCRMQAKDVIAVEPECRSAGTLGATFPRTVTGHEYDAGHRAGLHH